MESSAVYTDTQVVGIWDCANRCSESFQQCLIAASTIHPKLHCAVEDQLAKFSTWNAGMGIFTLERGCIHRRLRDVPEVQAVVRGLLESLDHQIQTCLKLLKKLSTTFEHNSQRLLNEQASQSLLDIAAEIKHLNKTFSTMRRAIEEAESMDATDSSVTDDESHNIEPILLQHFQQYLWNHFRHSSAVIQQRLTLTMLTRLKRNLYSKLARNISKPDPREEHEATLAQIDISLLASTSDMVATLEPSDIASHIFPFVCLFEDCDYPENLYSRREEWINHMNKHKQLWRCNSHQRQGPFLTCDAYIQHVRESHKTNLSETHLQVLAKKRARNVPILFARCPLCDEPLAEGCLDHIAAHLLSMATESFSIYENHMTNSAVSANHGVKTYQQQDTVDAKHVAGEHANPRAETYAEHIERDKGSGEPALRKRSRSRSRSVQNRVSTDNESERWSSDEMPPQDSMVSRPGMSRRSSRGKQTLNIHNELTDSESSLGSVSDGSEYRSSSIGPEQTLSPPTVSPKPNVLSQHSIKNPRGRRSKAELSKLSTSLSPDTSASGGPPVPLPSLNSAPTAAAAHDLEDDDDDDDDDDEDEEDNSLRVSAHSIDDITPDFAGFKQYILDLNPYLQHEGSYLVDRIANQQIVRYKQLLNNKINHLRTGKTCACGPLCEIVGGTATALDRNGTPKPIAPNSTGLDVDEEGVPFEGRISQGCFPYDIPMPRTMVFPACFECHLCFTKRTCKNPSDWTKHVHEDVSPFTCTWPNCRNPNPFKRMSDWVRHENEGHRLLEWWLCDVDDCMHRCFRRDNFLQHLVREHKFQEPKEKKLRSKKARARDLVWQKVEQCHATTAERPEDEACRFCGSRLPTWKKLTTHLAKHMQQIALPVLRLVEAKSKEFTADTLILPVQNPPPQQVIPPLVYSAFPGTFGSFIRTPIQNRTGGYQPVDFRYPIMQNSMSFPTCPPMSSQQMTRQHNNMGATRSRGFHDGDVALPYGYEYGPLPTTGVDMAQMSSMQGNSAVSFDNSMMEAPRGNRVTGSPFTWQGSTTAYSHRPNRDRVAPQHELSQLHIGTWIEQKQRNQEKQPNQQNPQN